MNRSLAGVVQATFEHSVFGEVYGASHGLAGVLEASFLDLRRPRRTTWRRVANTPGAALGSGRRSLAPQDVPAAVSVLRKHGIGYLFTIGGNDSAETAHAIAVQSVAEGDGVVVVHVPKTIDNDLMCTDHTPGYGSAARFVSLATMGAGRDAESMGEASPVTVLEVMGRDSGWLAAAAALGKRAEMDAPHYICVPEAPLDEARFLDCMEDAWRRWGFAVAVTAETVRGPAGPLGGQQKPFLVDDFGHEYFEGAGRYLAQLVGRELKVRVRYERPGTIQRSLMACVSRTDAEEASLVGRAAVGYAVEGRSDEMVTLLRKDGPAYECTVGVAPLEAVAGVHRRLPEGYVDATAGVVTGAFLEYARPLLGAPPAQVRPARSRFVVRQITSGREETMRQTPKRVLVVTPHPDDAEGGCGGTVARWIGEGAEVVYVLCTNGDKGTTDREIAPERLAAVREGEQREAARVLGVKGVVFLRHPDGGLEDCRQLRGQIVREIRHHRPEVVMCNDPDRSRSHSHRDHRVCGQVTIDAVCTYSWRRLYFPEHFVDEGLQPHVVKEIYLWGTDAPDTFVDISATLEQKVLTLSKHASQFPDPDRPAKSVRDHARQVGEQAGLGSAEAFRVVPFAPDPLLVG